MKVLAKNARIEASVSELDSLDEILAKNARMKAIDSNLDSLDG